MAVQSQPVLPYAAIAAERPLTDRGLPMLGAYSVATLIMVVAVAAVDHVGQWWILVPVMAVLFSLAAVVVAGIDRLLNDDGDEPPA